MLACPALAQPEPERLPDLTPRAFEIRGDLQISLPNLERQPLRGFAPPPRTYVVPADRRTFVAPYRQDPNDLPLDPLAVPPPPEVATLRPLTGRIDAGFGRYASRLGRFAVSRGGFGLNAAYAGFSDGPEDFDAASDLFDGRIAYASRGSTRFGFDLGGAYWEHDFFDSGVPTVPPFRPRWSTRALDGGARVAADGRTPFELAARFGSTSTTLGIDDVIFGATPGTTDFSETRLEGRAEVQPGRLRFGASGAVSGLGDEGIGESLTSHSAGGTVEFNVGRGQLEVGARLLGYDASTANGGGSSTNVGPVVRFETPLSPTTRLFLRTDPRVERRGLAGLYRTNPYVEAAPFVAPDLHLVDSQGGVEIQGRRLRVTAYGGYRLSPVTLYFEWDNATTDWLYVARYGETRVLRGGGSVTLYAPRRLRVTVGGEVRSGTLTSGGDDRDIPYFAPLTGHLSLALPFAGTRGLVQVTGTAESSRPTGIEDIDADGWATLEAEGHYWFASNVGLLVRAERLAGRAEQWPGFPRPPAAFLGGLRVRW
ncbi:MAG: hypothetical protein AAGI91_03690 [Bacteroidota bacterium]